MAPHGPWPRRHLLSPRAPTRPGPASCSARAGPLGRALPPASSIRMVSIVGEAVDVARPAVAKLALRNEKTGEMVVGYGSDLLFMRSYDIFCIG